MGLSTRRISLSLVLCVIGASPALAVEGGLETYLLGSRDSMAGVLPPAGTYLNNDFIHFSGSAPSISMGGAVLAEPDVDVTLYKFNLTHVFEGTFAGARLGVNINIPDVWSDMDVAGEVVTGLSGQLSDQQ